MNKIRMILMALLVGSALLGLAWVIGAMVVNSPRFAWNQTPTPPLARLATPTPRPRPTFRPESRATTAPAGSPDSVEAQPLTETPAEAEAPPTETPLPTPIYTLTPTPTPIDPVIALQIRIETTVNELWHLGRNAHPERETWITAVTSRLAAIQTVRQELSSLAPAPELAEALLYATEECSQAAALIDGGFDWQNAGNSNQILDLLNGCNQRVLAVRDPAQAITPVPLLPIDIESGPGSQPGSGSQPESESDR